MREEEALVDHIHADAGLGDVLDPKLLPPLERLEHAADRLLCLLTWLVKHVPPEPWVMI